VRIAISKERKCVGRKWNVPDYRGVEFVSPVRKTSGAATQLDALLFFGAWQSRGRVSLSKEIFWRLVSNGLRIR